MNTIELGMVQAVAIGAAACVGVGVLAALTVCWCYDRIQPRRRNR